MVRLAVTRMLASAPMWPLRSVPHNDAEAACRARARSPPHSTYHGTQVGGRLEIRCQRYMESEQQDTSLGHERNWVARATSYYIVPA